jgi:O-succinylbenzoic acid--CoA ligase
VAGLLQSYRAQLSGAKHLQAPELTWDAEDFSQNLQSTGSTVTSLVPTQIYDLVQAQKKAPTSLRCVFAGGGPLADFLFQQAQALGWPLVRTYGMTETSAMIAYKETSSNLWRRLPHLHKWASGDDQRLKFFGSSLLTGYLLIDCSPENDDTCQWLDPKQQGWFESDDRGSIENDELLLLGRESELVKIKGESVSLAELNDRWQRYSQEKQLFANSVIVSLPHERDGGEIVLVTEDCVLIEQIEDFQKTLLPFQKIQRVFAKTLIPRTELGKIKTADLIHSLGVRPR